MLTPNVISPYQPVDTVSTAAMIGVKQSVFLTVEREGSVYCLLDLSTGILAQRLGLSALVVGIRVLSHFGLSWLRLQGAFRIMRMVCRTIEVQVFRFKIRLFAFFGIEFEFLWFRISLVKKNLEEYFGYIETGI